MRIGIPRETKPGENRVAITPSAVRALRESGTEVLVETGAGAASGFEDREYLDAGAAIASQASEAWSADLVVKVKEPLPPEFPFLSEHSALFTFLHLAAFPRLLHGRMVRPVGLLLRLPFNRYLDFRLGADLQPRPALQIGHIHEPNLGFR